jgi:PAS domain S-box-containing protein
LFFYLSDLTRSRVAAAAIIPVIIFAILYGLWGGIIAGILSLPVNLVLFKIFSGNDLYDVFINYDPGGIIGHFALIITGSTVGYLRDIRKSLKQTIKKRGQAEKALIKSEERLRSLIQNIQAAVVVHGADTEIVASNAKAQELLGLTEDQMFKKTAIDPYWKFLNYDGTKLPVEEFPVNKVIATQQQFTDFILGIHKPDKNEIAWVLVNAIPVFEQSGNIDQVIVTFMDITQQKLAEEKREEILKELQEALSKVKTLSGLLPICASCKKIRDDKGYWNQIEAYIRDRSEAEFSHGICPECAKKLYPELYEDK